MQLPAGSLAVEIFFFRLEMVVAHSESLSLSRCALLKVTLDLSSRLLQLYKDVSSFPELFLPLTANLARSEKSPAVELMLVLVL